MNLPVSVRAFNKRGIGGGSGSILSRINSFARINSGASTVAGGAGGGGGGGGGYNRHRRAPGSRSNSGNVSTAGMAGISWGMIERDCFESCRREEMSK